MKKPEFKPSQVALQEPLPFIGTFRKAEAESAAAMMVVAMRRDGNKWRPVLPIEIGEAIKQLHDKEGYSWMTNPFCKPDFWKLVELGFAEFLDGEKEKGKPIQFTDAGIEKLRAWARED